MEKNRRIFPENEIRSSFNANFRKGELEEKQTNISNLYITLDNSGVEKENFIITEFLKTKFFMKYKKVFILIMIAIVILITSNPTNTDFKNYLNGSFGKELGADGNGVKYGRISYFGIFSIYKCSVFEILNSGELHVGTYIGIFKNFIKTD